MCPKLRLVVVHKRWVGHDDEGSACGKRLKDGARAYMALNRQDQEVGKMMRWWPADGTSTVESEFACLGKGERLRRPRGGEEAVCRQGCTRLFGKSMRGF